MELPNLHQDVARYIKSCLVCQRLRPGLERLQGLFRPHPANQIFEKVHIDLWGPCGFGGQSHTVLTMLDPATKWAECAPIPDKSAECIARVFMHEWISRWGFPTVLISDQDPSFCNEVLGRLCRLINTHHLRSTPYHPEGNSPVETFHRTLRKGLVHFQFFRKEGVSFQEALDLVLLGYRATPHLSTGESPAFLVYGADPAPSHDSDWRYYRSVADQDRARFLMWLRVEVALKSRLRVEYLREKYSEATDRIDKQFKLGDLVLTHLSEEEARKLSVVAGGAKLVPKWSTPARVIKVLSHGKAAIVRNLLSQKTKQIHIQNARFINLPLTETQKEGWEAMLQKAADDIPSAFDPDMQQKLIAEHFVPFGKRRYPECALEGDGELTREAKAPRPTQ
jgi:hypothetical protein